MAKVVMSVFTKKQNQTRRKLMNTAETRTGAATLLAASEIKGTKVINFQNQEIGDIDEVLIEPDMGQVRFAVLGVGGFLGLGSTKVAVPWQAFQIVNERGRMKYLLDATKERLEKAPRVEGKNYERLYPAETAEPIFIYWDVEWVAQPR
jgi:sporulation protein YlmC with PRC-barrel domain